MADSLARSLQLSLPQLGLTNVYYFSERLSLQLQQVGLNQTTKMDKYFMAALYLNWSRCISEIFRPNTPQKTLKGEIKNEAT